MSHKIKYEFENLGMLKGFFEESDEGILVADFETKKFIYANKKICRILGYTKTQLLKMAVKDIHEKGDKDKILKKFSSAPIGQKKLLKSLPVLRSDKKIVFCDIAEMALNIKDKKVVIGFFREVFEVNKFAQQFAEEEKSQKDILDILSGMYLFVDLKGRIRFANQEATEIFGRKSSVLSGESIFELIPDRAEALKKSFRDIVKFGKIEEYHEEIKKSNGEIGNFLTIIKPVKNEEGKIIGFHLSSYELRERRALEKIFRGKELVYSSLFEGSVIPMFVIDKKHKITHWNKACEHISGVSADKMIGTTYQWKPFYSKPRPVLADLVLEKVTQRKIEKWYSKGGKLLVKKSLAMSDVYQGEDFFPKLGKNGKWLYFVAMTIKDKDGKVVGALETLEDITEEKVDKQRLIESEKKFRGLYENVPGTVYRCLYDKNWTMIFMSRAIKDLCGYDPEEIVGNKEISYNDIIHPDDREKTWAEASRAIKNDEIFELDYRLVSKNGEIKWIHDRGQAIYGLDGKVEYVDGLLFDFTERKKVSEELKREKELSQKYLDLVGAIVVVIDRAGKVMLINSKGLEVLEGRSEEVLGKNWFNAFVPRQGRAGVKKVFKKILAGETKISEYNENEILTLSGKRKIIYWHNSVIRNDEGEIITVVSSGEDVTEKRRITKELADSERKYRTLVEFASDSILFIDTRGKIVEANRAIKEKLGYDREHIVGKRISELTDLLPSESLKLILKNFTNRLIGRESGSYVVKMNRKNGESGFFEISASIIKDDRRKIGVLAIIRDVTERERDKQAIKESEYKYRTLVSHIPNAVYTILPDKHRTCVFMSEKWKVWSGYSPEDFYKDKHLWFKIVHPNDRKNLSLTLLNAYLTKKPYVVEYRIIHRSNGKEHFILDQGTPVKNKNGELINYDGIATNITRLKQIEDRLKGSEERFRDISFSSGDIIWEFDLNGKYTFMAGDVERVLGYTVEEIIGKSLFDFMPKDEEARIRNEIKDAISKKRNIVDFENWRLSKSGKSQIMLTNGRILLGEKKELIGFRGVDKVITEKKMSEIKVRESEEKLKIVVESIGDGVIVLDDEYRIVMFNKEATNISGFTRNDVIGKRYDEVLLFQYENSGESNRKFVDFIKSKKSFKIENTVLVRKGGTKVNIADSAEILKDENGKIFGYVLVFRDVSREREIDKMKSEFISVASHQLKTPLSGIKWFIELLLREKVGTLNEKQKDFINQVRVSNERLITLVTDLLSVSHIETNRNFEIIKKPIDVCKSIDRVIESSLPAAKKFSVTVKREGSCPRKIIISADEEKIQQVFQNLVTNAIKYSKINGEVKVGVTQSKDSVIFSIHDDGIGIEEKDFPKVFTKFYRGDNAIKSETDGTGLGLYIAKAIIEAHKGKVWFESKIGKGSTFYFSLKNKDK